MAAIRQQEDADDLLDEIIDRYGDPPKGVLNLIDVALLRANARKLGIKDFGNLLPGHGGIMDRFDGWIYALPIVWLVML